MSNIYYVPDSALQEIFVELATLNSCDGYGASFAVEHALNCHVGGLVSQQHNKVRDTVRDLPSLVWGWVTKVPVICESSPADSSNVTLIADLWVHGVWQPQVDVLFDAHVADTDASSSPVWQFTSYWLCWAQQRMRRNVSICKEACLACHAGFIPLCFLVDGSYWCLDRSRFFFATSLVVSLLSHTVQ